MENKKTITLNNGLEMPLAGLGSYSIEGLSETIYESIKYGLRLIDTAQFYKNEKEIGIGITKALDEKIVKREELFIITKIWPTSKHNPEEALQSQLKDLNLSYVDCYLDHWPSQVNEVDDKIVKTPMHIFWKNMENLVRKNLTKSIGVSNYNIQSLINLISFCEIMPVLNQVEFHPYFHQKELLNFCKNYNILLQAYNSLCKGVYTKYEIHQGKNLNLLEENIVKELSEKYNRTPGQIVLNWAICQEVAVIPASGKSLRVKENIGCVEFRLEKEDIERLNTLNVNYRFIAGKIGPNKQGSFY